MPQQNSVRALAFAADGATLYVAIGSDHCIVEGVNTSTRETTPVAALPFCPERLTTFTDGSVLASSSASPSSMWIAGDGSILLERRTILAALDSSHLLEQTEDGLVWVDGEASVVLDKSALRTPRISTGGALIAIETSSEGERLVRFDGASPSAITRFFAAIDSWDVAPGGEEVVFSAKVDASYDIGIVSVSGGEVRWVAPDPADEKSVTWAPRGSKITYTFESLDATLVRSVHVPTSFQVIFDLPLTSVRQIAWEPRAERFAMVLQSPSSGDRIDWIGYQGDGRAELVESTDRVDSPVEALLWQDGSGILLGPETVRYGQSKATVVWIEAGDPFAWHPQVGQLRQQGLPVLIVVPARLGDLSSALAELPWASESGLYVVDVSGTAGRALDGLKPAAWFARKGTGAPEGATVVGGDDESFRTSVAQRIMNMEGVGR